MHQRLAFKSEGNSLSYISLTEIDDEFKATIHSHPNLEILLFIDGSGFIQTTSKKINVKKGDLVLLNQNCKHCEISDKTLKFYAIGINKLNIYLKKDFTKKIIYYSLNEQQYKNIAFLYELIYSEAIIKKDNYLKIIENSVSSVLLIIERQDEIIYNDSVNNKYSSLVSNIINIIDNNYYLNIKLEDIAHRLSTSKSTICHEFKKEVNKSIIEYKIDKQLDEAKNLLEISDMSIQEIALSVGFNNAAYFTKYFKDKFHLTPKEYKEQKKL